MMMMIRVKFTQGKPDIFTEFNILLSPEVLFLKSQQTIVMKLLLLSGHFQKLQQRRRRDNIQGVQFTINCVAVWILSVLVVVFLSIFYLLFSMDVVRYLAVCICFVGCFFEW